MGLFKTVLKVAKGDIPGAMNEAMKTTLGEKAAEELSEASINAAKQLLTSGTEKLKTQKKDVQSEEAQSSSGNISVQEETTGKPPYIPGSIIFAIINGKQCGPYNDEEFKKMIESNKITLKTRVWSAPMKNWERARKVDFLQHYFQKEELPPALPID